MYPDSYSEVMEVDFSISKQYILAKVENRESDNFYTFLDMNTLHTFKSIGTKTDIEQDIKESDVVEIDIAIKTTPEQPAVSKLQLVNSYITKVRKCLTPSC